jgi:A/G-specific adenine glycosylase
MSPSQRVNKSTGQQIARVRRLLLAWFDRNRRPFLWRRRRVTPWQVLVSEFFLRKTGAAKVDPVIRELLRRAPTPAAMARVRRREIARIIHPLGLQNIRARAIHEIAKTLVADHGGRVPRDPEALRALPHVGRYMVNAIRTVGFRDPQPLVDANIMRILHRVFGLPEAVEIHKADALWDAAARLLPRRPAAELRDDEGRAELRDDDVRERGRDLNWALVDFGALVCTARAPRCPECPIRGMCLYRRSQTKSHAARRRRESA